MNSAEELKTALAKYAGSSTYIKYPQSNMHSSDGVACFCRNAGRGAIWFLDIIANEPVIEDMVKASGFVMVMLTATSNATGSIVVSDEEQMFRLELPTGDTPAGEWGFCLKRVKNSKGKKIFVLMLPSEDIKDAV